MNKLKKIGEGTIFLVKSDNKNLFEKITVILKELINQDKLSCIYITFNKPAKILKKKFKSQQVNTHKLLFIDAITRLSEDVDFERNLIYISSPKDLTELMIIIRSRLEMTVDAKKKFIFVDSLSNLRNYNSGEETIKFVQSLANKLRLIEVGGAFLIVKGGLVKEEEVQECGKCVDKIIEL